MTIEQAQRKAFRQLALSAASAKRARDAHRAIMIHTFSYPKKYLAMIDEMLATARAANELLIESLLMPIVRVYPCPMCLGKGTISHANEEFGWEAKCERCDGDGYDAARLED